MDEGISDAELDQMEARAQAATEGPWRAFVEGRDHLSGDNFIRTGDHAAPDMYVSLVMRDRPGEVPAPAADLDFIASARQDVPRLVSELKRLRQKARP